MIRSFVIVAVITASLAAFAQKTPPPSNTGPTPTPAPSAPPTSAASPKSPASPTNLTNPTNPTSNLATVSAPDLADPNPAPTTIKVTLPGLKDGVVDNAGVFGGFGCKGDNKSLAISWSNAPKDTKSFAVIVHDPDAPTGVGFFHWSVFNLPSTTTKLEQGASGKTAGIEGYTDFGMSGYGGPCPPPGAPHRYIVTVYALKVPKLEGADQKSTGALLRFMLNQNTLALGRATATYGRAK